MLATEWSKFHTFWAFPIRVTLENRKLITNLQFYTYLTLTEVCVKLGMNITVSTFCYALFLKNGYEHHCVHILLCSISQNWVWTSLCPHFAMFYFSKLGMNITVSTFCHVLFLWWQLSSWVNLSCQYNTCRLKEYVIGLILQYLYSLVIYCHTL
jgi:hypothetical protein